MVNPRKALLVAALAIVSMSSCDNNPVEPTSVTPVDVTITVLDFHSGNSALSAATVTCIMGCESRMVGTTDSIGQTTLVGVEPLNVRVNKDGYISVEQSVFDGDSIVLEMDLVPVMVTVEAPFPPGRHVQNRGIEGVTVTCIMGCENRMVGTTDSIGQTTLVGVEPLNVRVETDGYISIEQSVFDGDLIIVSHEWPEEVEASLDRLSIPSSVVLNFGAAEGFVGQSSRESYCPVIIVKQLDDRLHMISILEHELRHAHQSQLVSGEDECSNRIRDKWPESQDGMDWMAATDADREAGRMVAWLDNPDSYFWRIYHESEAKFYRYWIRAKWPRPVEDHPDGVGVEGLCYDGESERCKYFQARYGARPTKYP